MSLSANEMRGLLALLDELLLVESMDDVEGIVLPGLARLFRATLIVYHYTVHLTDPKQIDIGWPPELFTAVNLRPYAALATQHPLVIHLGRVVTAGDDAPFAVSDLMSSRTWRGSQVYREAMRPLGGEDQLAIVLRSSTDHVEALSMTRWAGRFDDSDHELLHRARPHVAAAILRARRSTAPGWVALQVRPDVRWVAPTRHALPVGQCQLSPREGEVLTLAVTGLTNDQIGRRLGSSSRTVAKQLEIVYRKLGVTSRTAAARLFYLAAGA